MPDAPKKKLYLWMDLETNGQMLFDTNSPYPYEAYPLEIAFIITDADFNELVSFSRVISVKHHRSGEMFERMPAAVQMMHTENGLWLDCRNKFDRVDPSIADIMARGVIDEVLSIYANEHELDYTPRLVLSGSGVSHFDSRWLEFFFPAVWAVIDGYNHETKPTVDVGVIRRFLQDFTPVGDLVDKPEANIKHRAMDDVKQIIGEAKNMQSLFKRLDLSHF